MFHISSIQYRILDFEQFCVAAISHLMEGNGELGTTFKAWPISCLREMGTKLIRGTCLDILITFKCKFWCHFLGRHPRLTNDDSVIIKYGSIWLHHYEKRLNLYIITSFLSKHILNGLILNLCGLFMRLQEITYQIIGFKSNFILPNQLIFLATQTPLPFQIFILKVKNKTKKRQRKK